MELFRALAVFVEPHGGEASPLADALGLGSAPGADEFTETFILQLPPYASIYTGTEGMIGGEARDRIAGFWRALGQAPPAEVDHLTVMLALYARLHEWEEGEREAARREGVRAARLAFLWEHLLSWLPVYLDKLIEIAPPFYRRWGEMLLTALLAEAEAPHDAGRLPLHLRAAQVALADPRTESLDAFLQSVVAPVRSGMILTRADLSRAARTLSLGARLGERKFILKSLFTQDARATLNWLSREAALASERHRRRRDPLGTVAEAWEARAAASARLLEELEAAARETPGTTHEDEAREDEAHAG